ncbi:hypothetical protein [Pseudoduganella violacea]|uniref:Uncharacterized protein n=1 Tax=Pseudoduganella violacea TaxID=1715466 RepID=A0A7W5FWR4_9BURK|nr:hypothetical protein [Pseudoduganella violacea]MBB3121553.1 hypothetical protein [Pseudoduganella violacea]
MNFPNAYTMNGKTYDMDDLAFVGKGRNCFEFAYNLNFSAHEKDFLFDSGADNASGYIKHNLIPDYYNGKIFACDDPAAFQPLDIVIIARTNHYVEDKPLVQSHQLICLQNRNFDAVHFAGINNVSTLKNNVVMNTYTIPASGVQLFSVPIGNTWTVGAHLSDFLQTGGLPLHVFRLPAAGAFPFAQANHWISPKPRQ